MGRKKVEYNSGKSGNGLTLAQTRSSTLAEASFSSKLATSASFLPTFFVWAACAFDPVATLSLSVAGAVSAAVAPRGAADEASRAVRTRLRCRVAGILLEMRWRRRTKKMQILVVGRRIRWCGGMRNDRRYDTFHIRKTPKLPRSRFSGFHDFIATANPRPSTDRVSDGLIIPSSQSRAEANNGVDSCSICDFNFDVFSVSLFVSSRQYSNLASWQYERCAGRRGGKSEDVLGDRRHDILQLITSHDRDSSVRPHPEEPRSVRSSSHSVIPSTVTPTDDYRKFRHSASGDSSYHLRSILGDSLCMGVECQSRSLEIRPSVMQSRDAKKVRRTPFSAADPTMNPLMLTRNTRGIPRCSQS